MIRFVVAILLLLAFYHFARMAEALYALKKETALQLSKMSDEDRNDPQKVKDVKEAITSSNEKTFVHHCIWGGPFIWLVFIPYWWFCRNDK